MSAYLEAVEQARESREYADRASEQAQQAFVAALALAAQHHSLRQIAAVAGISFSGVKYLIDQNGTTGGDPT